MLAEKFQHLACPLDGLALSNLGSMLKCPHGHSYDIARQSYVNLLPVQQKKSRDPGDSKDMVAARTRYLNAGFFQAIASQLNELTLAGTDNMEDLSLLDAGCGDGYYLDYFYKSISSIEDNNQFRMTGLDISKWAIQAAAKRSKDVTWVVGNNQKAPVMEHSIDILWSVFGFSHLAGFKKMLKRRGKLIIVEAGSDHLIELRKIIYPKIRDSANHEKTNFSKAGFKQIDQKKVRFQTPALSGEQLADLLSMTPHLYRASHQGKQALQAVDQLVLTVDVVYNVYTADAI